LTYEEDVEQWKVIDNLIEKQEKEIERLKEFEKYYETEKVVWSRNDYISKDKIRKKIKELEGHNWRDGYMTKFDEYAMHYLEELLGE